MRRKTALLILIVWGVTSLVSGAQDLQGQTVADVKVQGLSRVSEQLVKSQVEVQPGQPYNAQAVARDVRRLYDLGYFSTIEVDAQSGPSGVVVTYICSEKQFIDEIRIIGNDKVKERAIRGELSWREGDAFVPEAYNEERSALLSLYQTKGFPNATVDIRVDEIGPSRVRITYAIDEGKKARISSIDFVGNEELSDRKLKKLMKTKRRWWFIGGKYNEETFEADLQNIIDEYGNYGRLEAEIEGTEFDYDDSGKGVDVTVNVGEGPEYTVETLEVANNVVYDDDEVLRLLEVQAGEVHNRGQVAEDAALVETGYHDSGYIQTEVTPQVTLDRNKKTTHVVHRVSEGDLQYVKEIKITGNTVTRDEVVRRSVLVLPGDRFDGGLLRMSQQTIESTEFFDAVRFTIEDNTDSDLYSNLLVDVDEGKTSWLNFGAGYSTEEEFSGFTELRFNNFDIGNPPNFQGGGQQLRLRLQLGTRRQQYYLSFTDPEIFGYPLAAGFDIYDESYNYRGGVDYNEQRTGAQMRFGKVLSPFVTARAALRYDEVHVTNFNYFAHPEFRELSTDGTTVSTIWGITRNTTNSRRDPSSGARHDFEAELGGLGGDYDYYRIEHDSTWYRGLGDEDKWVLSYRTREGWINDYGSPGYVPLHLRYFAGGTSTIRGYDNRDVGPKTRPFLWFETQRIGGELRLLNNIEAKYKISDMLRFYTFVDAGGVWREASDFDLGDVKYSAGIGFGVDIPKMGPVRLDYGIPLNADEDQGSGRLHLQSGFRF